MDIHISNDSVRYAAIIVASIALIMISWAIVQLRKVR